MNKIKFTYGLVDAREFLEAQLEMDARNGDHLTVEEYRWHVEQLIQVEQAETLERIAKALEELVSR